MHCYSKYIKTLFISNRIKGDGDAREKWIEAIETYQQFDHNSAQYSICEAHFDESDFIIKRNKRALQNGAIPTKFPEFVDDFHSNSGGKNESSIVSR